MPTFAYTARSGQGQVLRGKTSAPTEEDALATLQSQGLLVTSVRLAASPPTPAKSAARQHGRITTADLVLFSKQLATLLDSGVTLTRSLGILKLQCESRTLEAVLTQVLKEVEGGAPLHEALKHHPRVFNDFWVNLVKAGETSGRLGGALEQIAKYLETIRSLERKIISAMIYPIVLMVVSVIAVAVFLLKIVPIFSTLFAEFNTPLPWITTLVIAISGALQRSFLWGILVMGGCIYGLRRWRATERGRAFIDSWLLRIPLIGQLIQYSQVARFANSLSTLLESGVPILQALEIVQFGAGNVLYAKAVENLRASVREGRTISDPMARSGLFPVMMVQMVRAGEEIGKVAQMLSRVAQFYEERAETLITRVTTLFEPVVLVFIGGVIGVIVVAMYLPLFNLSQMGRGH